LSDSSERAFVWRYLDPVPPPVIVVAGTIRPDPTHFGELEYRAECLLAKWCRELAAMVPDSGRHNALRNKARAAGGLIALDLLRYGEVYAAFFAACQQNGLTQDSGGAAERTIRDGLAHGAQTPWAPNDLPDSPVWRTRFETPRIGSKKAVPGSQPRDGNSGTETLALFETARAVAEQALPQVAWIARPWIAEGGLTEVDGKVKQAGKTTWLLALIRCVLDGEPFMGENTLQTPVVLLSEQSPRSLQQALFRAGLEAHDDLHILFWHKVRELRWPHVVELAADKCREVGARLLAVDTLGQFIGLHGDSENNAGDALVSMQPLQAAIAQEGLAVVFNRHERKSGGEVGDSGRGSSAYAGAVDIIISLRRAGQDLRPTARHLHALSRFDETPQRTVIELQGMRYVVLGSEERVLAGQIETEILGVLGTEAEPMSEGDVQEQLTRRRADISAALKVLVATGRIRRIGTGKRGDPYRYFRPTDDADDDDDLEQEELP